MKLKENISLSELEKYGFGAISNEDKENDESYVLRLFDYRFNIGHARRGQYYYLLIAEKDRLFNIWATKPDGGGSFIGMPNVLIELANDGLIEKTT